VVLPVFAGTDRMRTHLFAPVPDRGVRGDPLLPPFQEVLMSPAGHAAALLVPCPAGLDRTGTTSGGRLGAKRPPQRDGRQAARPGLSGGASVPVVRRRIGEPRLPIAPSWAMGRRQRLGHVRLKACLLTGLELLAMIVAPICHHRARLNLQGLLGL
jgi:hypothetical protein